MIKPLPLYDGHLIGPGLVLYFRMLMFSVRTLSNEAHKPRGCRGRRSSLTTWPRLPVRYKAFTFQQDISVPSFGFKQSTVGLSAPRRVWLTSVICPFPWLVSSSSSPMIVSGTSVSARIHFFYGMGLLATSPIFLFYPGLGTAGYTHTGLDIPRQSYYGVSNYNFVTAEQCPIG